MLLVLIRLDPHRFDADESSCVCVFFLFLQEFNIEKLQLVEAEKKKIRQEYERKEKQVDVRKKM